MARPRSFDPDAVLTAAMLVFWEHGYEATSIRQLEVATGLSAPSLYGAFGDKQALFTAALQRYLDLVIAPGIETTGGRGVSGVRAMFASILDKSPDLPLGCLLAITSTEAGALGENPNRVLATDVDVPATADALLALYEGIQVLLRSSADHVDVTAIAGGVLDRLLPPPPSR